MVYPSNINLNLNTQYVLPIPTAQQGDTARVLTFNILNNGVPFNLTGKTVRAKIIKPDETKVYNDLTITNATSGECNLTLTNQVLAVVGIVKCQLEITEEQDILSTIIFNIEVRESIDVTGAVESSNEFTALQNGLTKLDEWDKYFKETSGAIEEKYTERLNEINSSLEESKNLIEQKANKTELNNTNSILNSIAYKQFFNLSAYLNKIAKEEPVKIVTVGDSMTYGQDTTSNDKRPPNSDPTLDLSYSRVDMTQASVTYPEALQKYLNGIYGVGRFTIINRGISGLQTSTALSIWTNKVEADLSIIMLGTNDNLYGSLSSFTNNYIELIKRYLDWGHAIIAITPPKHKLDQDIRLDAFRNMIKTICATYNIPVIDGNELLDNYPTDEIQAPNDTLHYCGNGYETFASKLVSIFVGHKNLLEPFKLNSNTQLPIVFNKYGFAFNYSKPSFGGGSSARNGVGVNATDGTYVELNGGKSFTLSFYAEEDNICLLPVINTLATGSVKITLDCGKEQSVDVNTYLLNGILKSEYTREKNTITFNAGQNQAYMTDLVALKKTDVGTKILRVVGKGWHNVKITSTGNSDTKIQFMGFVVTNYKNL